MPKKIAVILMTYGSPKNSKEVPQYLKNVYGGREPSPENVKEFQRRYKLIGGSPLIRITQRQAKALEKVLNTSFEFRHPGKRSASRIQNEIDSGQARMTENDFLFKVAAGMRFSHPFIEEVVADVTKDADMVVGIIMSPQYSPIIMSGYIRELNEAVASLGKKDLPVKIATDWHLQPFFLQALAKRVTEAISSLSVAVQKTIPVLFSAHSMPKRVIDKEPKYIDDLKETAKAVAKLAKLPKKRWLFCYQSAGHTPEEWLKPDFADIMPELAVKGQKHVLIAPVQFLADHLEILYDVGIGAREQAEEHGIAFHRTESLNTSPLFIKALAVIVKKTMNLKDE